MNAKKTTFKSAKGGKSEKPNQSLRLAMNAKPKSPISIYRQLLKRQKQIDNEIGKLMKEKVKNGFKILQLVLDHEDVKKLHQSR